MQQSPATPESPASPPCSGSSTDSAGGVDRSAARILMQLNHNYMKMDDSVANNHGSELATDSAAPAAAVMAPMPPPQQPPQQQQQLQPPPKQQKKLLPNGALFSTGGTICLEPYAAAAVAAQASRSAAATVKAINKSGNLQVKISRFPSTSPYQRPQNQVRQSPSASNVLNQQYQQQRTLLTATATTASSAGQSSHPQSSTSSTDSTTTNTTTTSAPSKRAVRDPSTHRESEKRRRERFNTSLTDLRELVPRNFVSKSCQNKVRLEKTEVINSAIAYIKFLKANAATGAVNNRNGYRLSPEAHLAWKEEDFKKRAGVIFNDDIFYPNHVISGGQSILARSTGGEQEGQQQQQPLTTASDLLQDLSNGGSGSRSRHGSCASSGSATTAYSLEELSPFNSTRRGSGGGEDSFMAGQSQPQQQQQMSMLTENSCPISPIVPIGGSGRVVYYLQPHQISHLQQQQQQQQMIKSETGEDSGISISDHMYHAMSPPVVVVSSAAASGNTINTNTNTNNIVNRSGTNGYNLFSL